MRDGLAEPFLSGDDRPSSKRTPLGELTKVASVLSKERLPDDLAELTMEVDKWPRETSLSW